MQDTERNEKLHCLFQKLKLDGMYPYKGLIFLPEPQRTNKLKESIEIFIVRKRREEALTMADLLTEPHRTDKLIEILDHCIELEDFYNAHRVADILFEDYKKQQAISK